MKSNRVSRIALCALLAALPLTFGCYVNTNTGGCSHRNLRAKAERSAELTAPLAEVTSLRVATGVGSIRLTAADVAEAQITAQITVKARTEEEALILVEQVQIRENRRGEQLTVEAIKPSDFGRNELAVDYTITVPGRLAVTSRTNVGDIRIDGFGQRVEAATDVGKILCAGLRSQAKLHANVGDIHATYAEDAPSAVELTATTNVGNIEFTGPADISARLSASANVGSINTDRPLTVSGPMKGSVKASLGQGEGDIALSTNVGSITIR